MKILIAEDEPTTLLLMRSMMSSFGDCAGFETGKATLKAFEDAWEAGEPYDVICLDIMLPDMSGHDVLKAIRAFESRYSLEDDEKAKIIMTTALHDEENFLQAHEEGSEWFLSKPISKNQVKALFEEFGLIKSEPDIKN
ncbi:MAG: response regulator [SAR324 cluster bacterium]|uniref:Response regulator n=1 Tax=SAR324 cluster bacterium TaxID=2024889 RepID=A0A7X9FPL8_9DELT|nr:response regulator [SAR324 cluster bacterium]